MMSIFDKRPPYVRWEEREMGLDPEATKREGRPIPRVVIMALITPAGSKDVVEKIATEWLKQIRDKAMQGEYPIDWVKFFDASFDEWKKGNELPREGTPIKTWAMATSEARTRLVALGITTVEDLAQCPDSGFGSIGLDARYLRDMARGWINEAKDKGLNAKTIADQNVEIDRLREHNQSLHDRVRALEEKLMDIPKRGKAA